MSASTRATRPAARWLPAEELRAMGFTPDGAEIVYGTRWGERGAVGVSFAPRGGDGDGFLYAHDRTSDRYLLLAAHTTRDRVDAAWRELIAHTDSPDGYVALAALDERPLAVDEAGGLLTHCLDRELSAYYHYLTRSDDGRARFDAAFAVIVQRSARVSAEDLLLDAARAESVDAAPVVVRCRLLEEPGWSGRIAGGSLESACATTRRILDLVRRHQLTLQATSVSHGHTTLCVARVPELAFASTRPAVALDAPTIGI